MRKLIILTLIIAFVSAQFVDNYSNFGKNKQIQEDSDFEHDEYNTINDNENENDNDNYNDDEDNQSSNEMEFGPVGGNLLRCGTEIGKVIKQVVSLATSLRSGNFNVQDSLTEIISSFSNLKTECSDPICLTDAKKRCEAATGKECEQWGLLMYPKCPEGTKRLGCCMCVPTTTCPPGYKDVGIFCRKPAPYGRGVGYPWKFGDHLNLDGARKRCEAAHPEGCEQHLAIIYPKCKEGFHNFGCCICTPNCPAGTTDIGVTCIKKLTVRGLGYPMKLADCSNNVEPVPTPVPTPPTPVDDKTPIDESLNNEIINNANQLQMYQSSTPKALSILSKLAGLFARLDAKLHQKV